MSGRRVYWRLLGLLALAATATSAVAGDAALQAQCFTKSDLAAVPGERNAVRGIHTFNRLPKFEDALQPFAPVAPAMRGAIRRVDVANGDKLVAFTFDLCEQHGEVAGYDGGVFDYLRAEGVRATLFAGGKWMRSHARRTAQLISDPLFEIANHSEAHRNLRLLDAPSMQTEINGPQQSYERARKVLATDQCIGANAAAVTAVPPRLTLFRFPYGACNAASLAAVNDAGLLAIQWDVSSGDPDPRLSAQGIANGILRRVKPGSIVVLHGNGRGWNTAAALPLVIPKLKALGYTFVTVSELLARGKPVIAESCYDSKPGDTDRYDHPLSLTGVAKAPGAKLNWTDATSVTPKKRARSATAKTIKAIARKPAPSKVRKSS